MIIENDMKGESSTNHQSYAICSEEKKKENEKNLSKERKKQMGEDIKLRNQTMWDLWP